MVQNGNGIYNSLDKDDISRYLTNWEDITGKIGHIDTNIVESGRVSITLNRGLELLIFDGWIRYYSTQSTDKVFFKFNQDLPYTNDDKLFSFDALCKFNEPTYNMGLVTFRPYPYSVALQSWGISSRIINLSGAPSSVKYLDGFYQIQRLNKNLVSQFYDYLDSH